MAIEGPLRELGIHDVFQLLDLSRKTGRLRVTSTLRDNEGAVQFRSGRVVGASIRSNPHAIGQLLLRAGKITETDLERAHALQQQPGERRRLGEILVAIGALTQREMERQARHQIETVVFELMSWQEGFFSFVEGEDPTLIVEDATALSTESLLMEAARRIDEWSRIAHLVPNFTVVPALADVEGDHASTLDLRPNEWEVLAGIDGAADLSAIAAAIGRSDFDVARVVYGLVSTGVVVLRDAPAPAVTGEADAVILLSDAREALRDGRPHDAMVAAERALAAAPGLGEGHLLAAQALTLLERLSEAESHLQRALGSDPGNASALMALARLAVRRGDLGKAVEHWERVLRAAPQSPHAEPARRAISHAAQLSALVAVTHDA
jgi:tetratricopeptide (TPR) repeat protein